MTTSLSSNLKSLMAAAHINPSELARRTGIAQPIIHRLSTGQNTNPKLATIQPIARYFTVTVSQLIGEVPLTVESAVTADESDWNRVPVISWNDAPHWSSIQPNYQAAPEATYISTDAKVSEQAYSLVVKSPDMGPLFPEGTTLIFEPNRQPSDRDFVLVQLPNEVEVRLRQILTDGAQQYLKAVTPEDSLKHPIPLQEAAKFLGVMAQARLNSIIDY